MNYDQHWLTSPPGPIAAQDWFVENLRQVFDVVPPQKIIVGIANYAYDWPVNSKNGKESAAEFSVQEALLHVEESDTDVEFDSNLLKHLNTANVPSSTTQAVTYSPMSPTTRFRFPTISTASVERIRKLPSPSTMVPTR